MDFLKKRDEIIAEHKVAERQNPHWKACAAAGDKISERPIAFQDDDEIVVVGDCVGKIADGLKAFKELTDNDPDLVEHMEAEKMLGRAVVQADKFLASPLPKELRMGTRKWNDLTYGLDVIGMHVVLTDGKE